MKFVNNSNLNEYYQYLLQPQRAQEKWPVFESLEEFKLYTFGKQVDKEKIAKDLFKHASEQEKYERGEEAVWHDCLKAVDNQLIAEHYATRREMLDNATETKRPPFAVQSIRLLGLHDDYDWCEGLFANKQAAQETAEYLKEHLNNTVKAVYENGFEVEKDDIEKE